MHVVLAVGASEVAAHTGAAAPVNIASSMLRVLTVTLPLLVTVKV